MIQDYKYIIEGEQEIHAIKLDNCRGGTFVPESYMSNSELIMRKYVQDKRTISREELYKFFEHMEEEDKKSMLGGMAWDDIDWHIHYANELGITYEQLAKDFPKLLGHIVKSKEGIN